MVNKGFLSQKWLESAVYMLNIWKIKSIGQKDPFRHLMCEKYFDLVKVKILCYF